MIKVCACVSSWQDRAYGAGHRAMNPCTRGLRCTVCLREYDAEGHALTGKKK